MTEDEARAALRDFDKGDSMEVWVAGHRAQPEAPFVDVSGHRPAIRFRLPGLAGGVRISATAPGGGSPATWTVPGE
jgi:hypothetical protein